MARQKGDGKGRMGGRKPGTPNKVPPPSKERLRDFVMDNYDAFCDAFKRIDDPYKKCDIYIKVNSFVTPKLAAVDVKADVQKKTYEDDIARLYEELDKANRK